MKKNTFKRVLAGSLALLTVAAYMPANVGGLIQVKDSLVANAATTVPSTLDFSAAKNYLTSINDGEAMSETQIKKSAGTMTENNGTTVVMKSSVPLTLKAEVEDAVQTPKYEYTVKVEKITGPSAAGKYTYITKVDNKITSAELDAAPANKNYIALSTNDVAYVYNNVVYTDITVNSSADETGGLTDLDRKASTDLDNDVKGSNTLQWNSEHTEATIEVAEGSGKTDKTILQYIPAVEYTNYDPVNDTIYNGEKIVNATDVKKELLKANGFEVTDNTYIAGSKFVDEGGKTFLAVGIKAIEPTTQPDAYGVYTYTYTTPNIAGVTVTVAAEKETGEVTFYDKYGGATKINDATVTTAKVDPMDDNQWKNLKITFNGATYGKAVVAGSVDKALPISSGQAQATISDFIEQGTVTITNTEPFVVYVDDKDSSKEEKKVEVTYANGLFTAEFTMPKSADKEKNVAIAIVKQEEKYSYALNSDKTALIANGTYTKNLEAASIAIKSYEGTDTNYFPATGTDAGVAVGSDEVDFGDAVVIRTTAGEKFINTNDTKVRITDANGSVLEENINYTLVSRDNGEKLYVLSGENAKSGTYTVTYDITTNSANAATEKAGNFVITKTFTIGAVGKITAKNIKLKITAKQNAAGVPELDKVIEGESSDFANDDGKDGKEAYYVQCEAGKKAVITLKESAKETASKYTFYVQPVITVPTGANTTKELGASDFTFSGDTFTNKNETATIKVKILSSDYTTDGDTISLDWAVMDYDAQPLFNEELNSTKNSAVSVAVEDAATLGTEILTAAAKNDAAKALTTEDVTFEYVAGTGANRAAGDDELDAYESGLPTEKGDYTVYMSYGDEIVTTAEVKITSYKVNFVPDAAALSIGYGKDFTVDTYKLLDANGKAVKGVTISDLKVQFMQPTYEYKNGKYVQTGDFEVANSSSTPTVKASANDTTTNNDLYKIETAKALGFKEEDATKVELNYPSTTDANDVTTASTVLLENLKDTGKLNAGTYYVKFNATLSNEDDYAFASDVYELTVSKKALSDSTINILVAPNEYKKGTTQTPDESSITAKDADTGFNFIKITTDNSATPPTTTNSPMLKLNKGKSAVEVGSYDLEIGLVDSATQNYEGTATTKWCIVNKTTDITTGLKWDDTMTTLYDNGRIHLEINKNAVGRINLPSDVTISEFGVIADNSGKIPAPNFDGTYKYGYDYTNIKTTDNSPQAKDASYAIQQLQLGNEGYLNGKYTAKGTTLTDGSKVTANDTVYKTNVKVKDVKTGIWARPYILLSDGTVAYGPVKYVNLEEEAKEKLNLQMPYDKTKPVVRQANMTDEEKKKASTLVNAGYDPLQNRAYAYTTFTDLSSEGFKGTVLEVSDFGVVVDNKNAIEVAGDYANLDETQKTKVNEKLVIGGNSKLIVGHYQKGNKNLAGDNEYTANIKIYNSETGVWIRPYLDLGNDLIVYGDPIYVQSVSEYFSDGIATLEASVVANQTATEDMKIQLAFAPSDATTLKAVTDKVTSAYTSAKTGNKAKDAPEVKVVKAGVVLDKKGTLVVEGNKTWANDVTAEATPSGTAVKAASTLYPTAKANLILGNGFVEGKKTSGLTNDYIGKVSPAGKDLIVKNYVIYDIGGTKVTVYGAAQAYEYKNKNWELDKAPKA